MWENDINTVFPYRVSKIHRTFAPTNPIFYNKRKRGASHVWQKKERKILCGIKSCRSKDFCNSTDEFQKQVYGTWKTNRGY